MRVSYSLLAMGARQSLNRDFRVLSSTTNTLLADLGVPRASRDPAGLSLNDLAAAEQAAVSQGISVANDQISSYQVADEALANLHTTLQTMRDIVEDVALNSYSEEELAAKDDEYQELVEQVTGILADTAYEGTSLLSGYDAVVSLDLNAVTDMSMTALPTGAMTTASLAVASVTGARSELTVATTSAENTIEDLQDHAEAVTAFESRVSTASSALAVLESLMTQLAAEMSAALSAQANASPWTASELLVGT